MSRLTYMALGYNMKTIENDDQETSNSFDLEDETEKTLPKTEKDYQKLLQKRRAVEEKLAQMQLERETRDFDFDDLDD
jgi:hypothetical protein